LIALVFSFDFLFTPIFHGEAKPIQGWVVGYVSIIEKLNLQIPYPSVKAMVSKKNQKFETQSSKVFPLKYLPVDNQKISLMKNLVHFQKGRSSK